MKNVWLAGPQTLSLAKDAVHLWLADLDRVEAFEFHKGILSHEEQGRANRFKFWRDQRRYINGRGILRVLLGRYLRKPPQHIEIEYSAHGKLYLTNSPVNFNLAHCQDQGLYGFCLNAELGVDIECLREISDAEGIAKRFFSPQEYDAFLAKSPDEQMQHFFSIWTLKEAFIKAVGQGLSYPLDAFVIHLNEGDTVKVDVQGRDEGDNWSLHSFHLEENCFAGIALKGKSRNLHKYRY